MQSRNVRTGLAGVVVAALVAVTALVAGAASGARSETPIVVGMFQPTAAAVGGFGQAAVDGAQLAVKQINSKGGINGHPINLLVQDDGCTSADGVTAVQKLLSESPKPIVLMGGLCSASTVPVLPIVQRAKIPLLVDLASNPEITAKAGVGGNPWVFRWGPNDDLTAKAGVLYLSKFTNIHSIAIVNSDEAFGVGGQKVLAAAAAAHGIKVLSKDTVNLANPDFASVIARIQSEKPDAVALWLNASPNVATFYTQYGVAGLKKVPLVGQLDMTQKAIAQANLMGFNSAAYSPDVKTPGNRAYLAAWKAAGKKVENAYVGWDGYQGMLILAAALKQAKSLTPAGVQQALASLDYSPTIMGGTIKFDSHHQAYDNIVIEPFTGSKTRAVTLRQNQ
jgi:branched-chain amino acid transport system substrate-binding protein